ncbi:MAG: hypothetical protein AB8H03_20665 [Saprospiraceae bacterium]
MKHIKLFLPIIFLFFFSASLNAQTEDEMITRAKKIMASMQTKGYDLRDALVFAKDEFAQGYADTLYKLYPMNNYKIIVADDGKRNSQLQLEANTSYDYQAMENTIKIFKQGAYPDNAKSEMRSSYIEQDILMRAVLQPVDYTLRFSTPKKDIKEDSKLLFMVFYKSTEHIQGNTSKNDPEQHYHQEIQKTLKEYKSSQPKTDPVATDLKMYKEIILKDVAKYGYSLADYQTFSLKDFPKKMKTTIYGGNRYLLVLHSANAKRVQLKGTPDEKYNLLAKMTDGMDEIESFEAKSTANKSTHQIDFRASLYNTTYTLNLEGKDDAYSKNSMASFFVFYKSYENMGGPEDNKAENFYSKKVEDTMISSAKESVNEFEKAMGYEFTSLEELIEETKNLTIQSASGMELTTAKTALNIWKDAMVLDAKGKNTLNSIFKIMDTDWQSDYSKYRNNHTIEKLHHELKGAFSYRGFTKDGLFVVDHVMDESVIARYYFKFPKNKKRGGIIPKYEIKDGKLHLTAWQKAVVPN